MGRLHRPPGLAVGPRSRRARDGQPLARPGRGRVSERPLSPPSGHPPPEEATVGGGPAVALRPVAEEICRRYRAEFPDERERYGDAGIAWCVHDNQHILNWAFLDDRGWV